MLSQLSYSPTAKLRLPSAPGVVKVGRYLHSHKNGLYAYERLYVTLTSPSRPFLDWAQAATRRLGGIAGTLTERTSPQKRPVWVLRYAKRESVRLLRWIYYSQDLPCLARKRARAERFLLRSS